MRWQSADVCKGKSTQLFQPTKIPGKRQELDWVRITQTINFLKFQDTERIPNFAWSAKTI